jgi:hypothetical protein
MERYVSFVKEWASDHGLTYMCSIGDPRLKADYAEFKKTGIKPKKSGRASKYQSKEEARLANIAKTAELKRAKKMIQAGTPDRVVEAPPPPPPERVVEAPATVKDFDAGVKELYRLARMQGGIKNVSLDRLRVGQEHREEFREKYGGEEQYDTPPVRANIDWLNFINSIIGDNAKPKTKAEVFKKIEERRKAKITVSDRKMSGSGMVMDTQGEGIFDRGNQMPPSARDYLKKNGNQTITSMRIERIPLGGLQKSLTAIVYVRELLTKFKKPENIPQDDLFHLQMVLTLSNGRRVMWGKEEVIKLSETIYKGDKMESRDLGKTNIKLQDFVDKTAKTMGAKFAPYNAFDNNCQDFIMATLKSNGLGTQADYDFVKQDTKDLFKGRQWLIDMMKGATDLASAFNVFWEGKGTRK